SGRAGGWKIGAVLILCDDLDLDHRRVEARIVGVVGDHVEQDLGRSLDRLGVVEVDVHCGCLLWSVASGLSESEHGLPCPPSNPQLPWSRTLVSRLRDYPARQQHLGHPGDRSPTQRVARTPPPSPVRPLAQPDDPRVAIRAANSPDSNAESAVAGTR